MQQPPDSAQQGQQADQRSQAVFEMGLKQTAKMLTSEKAAATMARDAKVRGPAPAIVDALGLAIKVMAQGAQRAGVQMPPAAVEAIALAMARLLVAMMVGSGLAKDPDALLQQVMAGLQGQQPAEPQQPPTQPQGTPAAPTGLLAMGDA